MGATQSRADEPPMQTRTGTYTAAYLRATQGGYTYGVGYAPSGQAKCRGCKAKIAKGTLRVTRCAPSPFDCEGGFAKIQNHFHPEHAFEAFMRSKCSSHVPLKTGDLEGMAALTPADRKRVSQAVQQFAKAYRAKCRATKN